MDEASRGKQHTQHTQPLKPSRLREAHQVPNSDEAVPDTQFDNYDNPPAEDDVKDEDIDAADLAFLKRNGAKPLGEDAQTFSQTFGISKPTSAAGSSSQTCFGFAKPPIHKATSKPDTLISEHSINADTAIPSIEATLSGEPRQAIRPTEAFIPEQASHAATEVISCNPTTCGEIVPVVEGLQNTSHPVSAIDKERHGSLFSGAISKDASYTQVISKPLSQAAATVKKKATTAKAKRGRKILLSRPLVPWPPRQDSASDTSKAIPVNDGIEGREEEICSIHSSEAFAVNPQPGRAFGPVDGLRNSTQPFPTSPALVVGVAIAEPFVPNVIQCENDHHPNQLPPPRHQASADGVNVLKLVAPPVAPDSPLTPASREGFGRLQNKHARSPTEEATGAPSVPTKSPMPLELLDSSDDLQDTRSHHRERSAARPSPGRRTAEPISALEDRSEPANMQEQLHRLSDQPRHIRVTKTPKRAPHAHNTQGRKSAQAESSQVSQNFTVLNSALEVIRNACVADQHRAESQTATIRTLKEEKEQLQQIISQQEKDITALKVTANSHVKYMSGLEKDHENIGKKFAQLKGHIEQLQQRNKVIRENNAMKDALLTRLASLAKLQKDTLAMAKEAQIGHVAALKREKALKDLIDHQASMHNEGEKRRIELEEQLLPSFRRMQRKLDEGFGALAGKVDSVHKNLEGQDDDRCNMKECLLILKRLDSLPLLTTKHVQKAEGMLRSLHEWSNAKFNILARSSDIQPFPMNDIQHFVRDQIERLQSKLLQYDHTLEGGERSQETVQSLSLEMDMHRQDKQQLEGQVNVLRQAEAALDSRIDPLEQSNRELRSSLHDYATSTRESELKVSEVRDKLSQAQGDLRESSNTIRQKVRLSLDQAREFASYRAHALVQLKHCNDRVVQVSNRAQAEERKFEKLRQDADILQTTLKSAEKKIKELTTEVKQHEFTIKTLRQEHQDALEKEGQAQSLLSLAQETNRRLEQKGEQHVLDLDDYRTQLHESNNAKLNLSDQQLKLQQQLTELSQNARHHGAQLQRAKVEFEARLQQTQADHAEEMARLRSSLTLSENARKESEAKFRQTEAAHRQQIDYHKQKAKAKFQELASEAEQTREELEAEHEREIEQCRKDVEHRVAMKSKAAKCGIAEVLVPNTQQATERGECDLPAQPSKKGESRKRVDGHAKSAANLGPPDNLRVDANGRTDAIEGSDSTQIRVETGTGLAGYFEEEYENRFGSRTQSRGYRTQPSVVDPDAEVVPETQDFQCAPGGTAPFETIESQSPDDGDVDQEEAATELSNMASEDLSEMLLDLSPDGERRRSNCTPHRIFQTPGQSTVDLPSDDPPMNSQSRPKSRANTASRMMPLSGQDLQQRQGHIMSGPSERSIDAHSEDSPELTRAADVGAHRTHVQHASAQMTTNGSHTDLGRKRRATGEVDVDPAFKKLRASVQSYAQRPSPTSRSYTPYTPASPGARKRTDIEASPSSATGRRSSSRRSIVSGSQGGIPRLSSTRNTRSKANQYADRFGQELDGQ